MHSNHLDFYFDFISPYAYFAWKQITTICDDKKVELRVFPVIFGKLLDHWGQLGPAEIPPKRDFVFKNGIRYAKINGFEFNPPKFHPFYPIFALRLALKEVAGEKQRLVIRSIFEAGWSFGKDLGDPKELASILNLAGLNGEELLEKSKLQESKKYLRKSMDLAIDNGVFGVPTIIFEKELYWGNDQMEFVKLAIDGKDPIKSINVNEFIKRERGIDRKKVKE